MGALTPVAQRTPTTTLYYSLCEILAADDRIVGAGMIVDETRIVTCAHVIGLALMDDPNAVITAEAGHTLKIRRSYLPDQVPKKPSVVVERFYPRGANDERADIAILRLVEGEFAPGPQSRRLLPEVSINASYGEEFLALGFPSDKKRARNKIDDARYKITIATPIGWYNSVAVDTSGGPIRQGFSGGPAWSTEQGAVIGICTEADDERRSATVIPISTIVKVVNLFLLKQEVGSLPVLRERQEPIALTTLNPLRRMLDWIAPNFHYWLTCKLGVLNIPPESKAFAEEMRSLAARLRQEVERATYLPPPAREPQRDAPAGFEPLRQLIRSISEAYQGGGDSATAELSAMGRRSRPVRRLLGLLLTSPDPIILLGDPGSGKSLTLQQTAMTIAKINTGRVLPAVCIFLRLGRWSPSLAVGEITAEDVEMLVLSQAPPRLQPYLRLLADDGRLIVIFDGMDEMSRIRYLDHTAALSIYAEQNRDRIRTLFSCRISDFSPTFRHRRLVLLPFDRTHVHTYVHRQFGKSRIRVGDRQMTGAQLVESFLNPSFPVRASNPYMLHLLCLYVRDKEALPQKRIDILEYYFASSLDRETRDGARRLDKQNVFDALGELALEITYRNRGTEIARVDIDPLLRRASDPIVELARDAGILVESLNENPLVPSSIRFSNHRTQEFFAAYAIFHSNDVFDWQDKLGVPRWQETLVNLAQMGRDSGGARELVRTMDIAIESVADITDPVSRTLAEADVSERVYLAARVARDVERAPDREPLMEAIDRAVAFLAASKDAVSRASILRVIYDLPEISGEILSKLVADHSRWVAEQAQIVAAEMGGRGSSGSVADSLIAAVATGDAFYRLPAYLKMAKRTHSFGLAATASVAFFCILAQYLVFGAVGPTLGWLIHTLPQRLSLLADLAQRLGASRPLSYIADVFTMFVTVWPWYLYLQVFLSVTIVLIVLARRLQDTWLILSGFGAAMNIFPLIALCAWLNASGMTFSYLMVGILIIVLSTIVCVAIIPLFVLMVCTPFALITAAAVGIWTRSGLCAVRALAAVYSQSSSPALVRVILGVCAFFLSIATISYGIRFISGLMRWAVIDFPYVNDVFDTLISFSLYLSLVCIFLISISFLIGGRKSRFFGIVSVAIFMIWMPIIYTAIGGLIGVLIFYVAVILDMLGAFWKYVMYVILAFVTLAVVATLVFVLGKMLKAILRYIESRIGGPQNPQQWAKYFRDADPAIQPALLAAVTPKRLGLNTEEMLRLLSTLYAYAETSAVHSSIDKKRAEILAVYRHERGGEQ